MNQKKNFLNDLLTIKQKKTGENTISCVTAKKRGGLIVGNVCKRYKIWEKLLGV